MPLEFEAMSLLYWDMICDCKFFFNGSSKCWKMPVLEPAEQFAYTVMTDEKKKENLKK